MLRRLGGLSLVAMTGYVAQDATNDMLMYAKAKEMVRQRVGDSKDRELIIDALGAQSFEECSLGPWYNSSVMLSHGGMMTSVTMPCTGPTRSSDIAVKMARKGGLRWPLLYTALGGEWDVLIMDATVGMAAGGRPIFLNLLHVRPRQEEMDNVVQVAPGSLADQFHSIHAVERRAIPSDEGR